MSAPKVPAGLPPAGPPAGAPPPYGYGQPGSGGPMMGGQPMMVQQQPMITVQMTPMAQMTPMVQSDGVMYSRAPTVMQCPSCHQQIVTHTTYESGCCAWLGVGGCLLLGCWLGCCLIPLCMSDFQDVVHSCPNCHQYIGTYQRM